ncbi:MAG: hypothetical protein JST66_13230 [Bacteroidetes bacterium]|nr:hypothetical protein [Bacteroidota bacterium]
MDTFAYAEPPWPTALDLYRAVRKVTPDSLTYLLEDNFKYITLYNNKVTAATATMSPDSSWTVEIALTAEKMHADSLGRETPVPMDDWIDLAIPRWPTFGKGKELNDMPLLQQRVKLRTGENTFTFRVPSKPAAAEIDPDHLFFDREPTDNRRKVDFR